MAAIAQALIRFLRGIFGTPPLPVRREERRKERSRERRRRTRSTLP